MRATYGMAMMLSVGLAACGDGGNANDVAAAKPTAAPAAAAGTDPCSLVTTAEIVAIIGEPIVAKAAHDGSCQFQTADAAASSVTIELNQTDAAGQMALQRKAAGMLGAGGTAPELGDEAMFGPNAQLSVRKGTSYVAVTPPIMRSRTAGGNSTLSADEKRKMAVAIAEKALARLP